MNLVLMLIDGRWKLPLILLLIIGAGFWINHIGYQRGELSARRQCQAAQAHSLEVAVASAQRRQAARDNADTKSAQRARDFANARAPQSQKVNQYVQSPAAHQPCLDADGVRLGSATIHAANTALTAR